MRSHKELDVWQKGMALVTRVYQATREFPPEEVFGLTSQMRRAAVSVPSNIAEGAGRGSRQEFVRFLNVAMGSAAELETQILIARNLGYEVDGTNLLAELDDVRRMLAALTKTLKAKTGSEEARS